MMRRLHADPRWMVILLSLLAVCGVAGFATRTTQEDPTTKVRWGYVTTRLDGAEPLEIESLLSEPIEMELRETGVIESIESSSLPGVSLVSIRLTADISDVQSIWTRIQHKLNEVTGRLPKRASTPILIHEKKWAAHTRIAAIYPTGEVDVSAGVLARWAKELNARLSFVPGTLFSETVGIPKEEVLVEIDELAIASTGLTVEEISQRIRLRESEGNQATSHSDGTSLAVSLSGQIDQLSDLRSLVLRGDRQDRRLLLGDVATIRRDQKDPPGETAWIEGRRAAVIATRMNDREDINDWTQAQDEVIDQFQSSVPTGLKVATLFDQKRYTDQRAGILYENLGLGMLLVVIVVCLIMGWRAAIPICAALPLTMCLVLFMMIPFDITLHQMSIAGLIMALGMLIDNPIIVVDDLQQRLDAGSPPLEALRQSVGHLASPLIGSNATTILGFTPISLAGGATGEFLAQMAWSVIACLIGSLLLSLTIIPVLATWCLRPRTSHSAIENEAYPSFAPEKAPPQQPASHRFRDTLRSGHRRLLRFAMTHPLLVVVVSLVPPAVGFVAASQLRLQFFPIAERDHFYFSVRLPTHASIDQTIAAAKTARQYLIGHPEVESVDLYVGKAAPKLHYSMVALEDGRPNFAQGIVHLTVPQPPIGWLHRIQQDLDERLPGAQCIVTMLEQGPPATAPIEIRLYGPSLATLAELGERTRSLVASVAGITHTRASIDLGRPRLGIDVRQDDAEAAGLTDDRVARQLRNNLDGLVETRMSEGVEEIPVRVRLSGSSRNDPERILSLPLISPHDDDGVMSLSSVARWSIDQQLFSVYRRNSSRCNIIYGYVWPGLLPAEIEREIRHRLDSASFQLPAGYHYDFGGISAERDAAVGGLYWYSAVVGVLMIAVLVFTFGSFRLAAIVFGVAVSSVGLGLLTLWLFDFPLGVIAIIGIVGMMGLAINDSIVVLAECQHGGHRGKPVWECVEESTRHILTTSITTVAGVLPLILQGGVFWPPMMIVIAGGIVGATLIALGFTPACFVLFSRKRSFLASTTN